MAPVKLPKVPDKYYEEGLNAARFVTIEELQDYAIQAVMLNKCEFANQCYSKHYAKTISDLHNKLQNCAGCKGTGVTRSGNKCEGCSDDS